MKIFDLHCDTIYECETKKKSLQKNEFQVDMEKLKSGESYAQCFAIFLNREDCKKRGVTPFTRYRQMYACFQEELKREEAQIRLVTEMDTLASNYRQGKLSAILTVEGADVLEGKSERLNTLYQDGVRHMVSCASVESVAFGSDFDGIDERVEWKNFSGMQLVVEALGRYQKGYGVQSEKLSEGKYEVTMLFYNGGAKLTCEESSTLEDLKSLEAQGVEILTCGTCLNYYGLTERLQVGSVSNMYAIAEKLTQAGHIIKP